MGKRGKEKLIRGFTARLSERFSRQGADAIGADANGAGVTEECVTEDVRCAPAPPYGVHVWHDCPDAIIDICFIHGLTGDRDRTWTAHGQPHPWPKTLLAPKLEFGARILTYGYDAYLVSKGMASQNRLADHARNMVNDLATNRTSQGAANRPHIHGNTPPRSVDGYLGENPRVRFRDREVDKPVSAGDFVWRRGARVNPNRFRRAVAQNVNLGNAHRGYLFLRGAGASASGESGFNGLGNHPQLQRHQHLC
jgi:hypothetical protein